MDAVSYSYADAQKKKIDKFVAEPTNDYGVVTTPSLIPTGESVSIPAGRQAVVSNLTVEGTLTVDGELGIIGGGSVSNVQIITNEIIMDDTTDGKTYSVKMTNGAFVIQEVV